MQGTLALEHVSTQGTLARKARWNASTFLARRAVNLAGSFVLNLFFLSISRDKCLGLILGINHRFI